MVRYSNDTRQNEYENLLLLRRLRVISAVEYREKKAKIDKREANALETARRRAEKKEAERRKREAEKEAERIRKEKARAAQIAENRRLGQEKRKATIAAKKAAKIAEERRKRGIPFEKLIDWVNKFVGNKNSEFVLELTSAINGYKKDFYFKSFQHFENWLSSIEKQKVIKDSENYTSYAEAVSDKDVFEFIIPELLPVSGGCSSCSEEFVVKETPYYSFDIYNPNVRHNNCAFRCIEHVLHTKLDYAAIRKELGIKYDVGLTPEQFYAVYKNAGGRQHLIFVDENFNEHIQNTDFASKVFILVNGNHYYVIIGAKSKTFKNVKTKRGFLYWDIETRPTSEYVMVGDNKSYILKDTILCAYYKPYKCEEYKQLTFITNSDKSSCRQFIDWLSCEANSGRFYNCVAHNGSRFDIYFLLSNLTQQEQLMSSTQLRGYSVIGFQYKSHLFKDSCCFLTASLDSLCSAFKVKQSKITEFNYKGEVLTNKNICFYKPELGFSEFLALQVNEPEFWNMYVEYCMFDCIGLMNVWTSFKTQYDELMKVVFKYKPELLSKVSLMGSNTIGSLSKKILENTCLEKGEKKGYVKTKAYKAYLDFMLKFVEREGKNVPVVDEEKVQFINKFKRGGISHTNQPGKHTHSLISYDIASQYPASMMYMLIPSGLSKWVSSYNKMWNGFYLLKNLKFKTSYKFKPVASKNENGVLEWNTETIDEIYMDSFMIKYMKENYGLESFEVVKGLVSCSYIQGKEIFGDYVETLYNEKKLQDEYKKKNDDKYNPALRECIKLFLNSLSGKLVEDPSNYFQLEYTLDDGDVKLNGLNAEKVFSESKMNTWVSAGVMVYSWSKRLLFEYVKCLPKNSDDVIHIETDSIYFNKKHNEEFIENVKNYKQGKIDFYPVEIGSDLGNVKVEKDTSATSYFLGKKFYCIGDLYKIKGIPLKTIDEYGNDVELVNTELYETIYNGQKVVKSFYTMKKALFSENTYISSHKMSRTISPSGVYSLYK